jgi:alkylation response protein AidB-like acyl-CoA dehydrogenase
VPEESMLGHTVDAGETLKKISEKAAVVKCAEMVGGAQRILEMTLNYVKERSQFGHPIGSFQAIQHHCANMAVDVETSRLNTYYAAWLLSEGLSASKHVAVAKAWVSEAYRRITSLSHQIHGAIGFTKELDLELYVRRAKAAEVAFGDANFHRKIIAQELKASQQGN